MNRSTLSDRISVPILYGSTILIAIFLSNSYLSGVLFALVIACLWWMSRKFFKGNYDNFWAFLLKPLLLSTLILLVVRFAYNSTNDILSMVIVCLILVCTSFVWFYLKSKKLDDKFKVDVGMVAVIVASVLSSYFIAFRIIHKGESVTYTEVPLADQGPEITIAAFIFAIVITLLTTICSRFDNKVAIEAIRRMTNNHITETSIMHFRWDKYIRGPQRYDIGCYHSTSHLFGFWLKPTAQGHDLLSAALMEFDSQSRVRLIGPSPLTLKYLILSCWFKHFYSIESQNVGKNSERISEFLRDIIRQANPSPQSSLEFFRNDRKKTDVHLAIKKILERRDCDDWWNIIDLVHWSLLSIYYTKLNECYRDADLWRTGIHFANRDCYDEIIKNKLSEPIISGPWLENLNEGETRASRFLKEVHVINRLFFPHCSFAIIGPSGNIATSGIQPKVLLSHDVLETLNFNRLSEQSKSILEITSQTLVSHHESVFESEWGTAKQFTLQEAQIEWTNWKQAATEKVNSDRFTGLADRMRVKNYEPR